jgi:hypothetical protein
MLESDRDNLDVSNVQQMQPPLALPRHTLQHELHDSDEKSQPLTPNVERRVVKQRVSAGEQWHPGVQDTSFDVSWCLGMFFLNFHSTMFLNYHTI